MFMHDKTFILFENIEKKSRKFLVVRKPNSLIEFSIFFQTNSRGA